MDFKGEDAESLFKKDKSSNQTFQIRKERLDEMQTADSNYLKIVDNIFKFGKWKNNRTNIKTLAIAGAIFEHDMKKGFPLLTTKKMPFKSIASELEFFIKGKTDKKWLQERNNSIWNEWASPKKVQYGHDENSKKKMFEERDLGPIYGFQWRHFNAPYTGFGDDYTSKGVDQLLNLVKKLKEDPNDRRMIVSAWNPQQISEMALPPCHYSFQVIVINDELNLLWNQRSVDTMLGLPFNIASYGLMLHLLAKESGLKEGKLVGFLADVHIYENHLEGAKEQLKRDPNKFKAPKIKTENFKDIFNWEHTMTKIEDYESYPKINFEIAV
ncbi:MAG: thymidylate synthase [Candidatus Micrarchaeaceae archaeon]